MGCLVVPCPDSNSTGQFGRGGSTCFVSAHTDGVPSLALGPIPPILEGDRHLGGLFEGTDKHAGQVPSSQTHLLISGGD